MSFVKASLRGLFCFHFCSLNPVKLILLHTLQRTLANIDLGLKVSSLHLVFSITISFKVCFFQVLRDILQRAVDYNVAQIRQIRLLWACTMKHQNATIALQCQIEIFFMCADEVRYRLIVIPLSRS